MKTLQNEEFNFSYDMFTTYRDVLYSILIKFDYTKLI